MKTKKKPLKKLLFIIGGIIIICFCSIITLAIFLPDKEASKTSETVIAEKNDAMDVSSQGTSTPLPSKTATTVSTNTPTITATSTETLTPTVTDTATPLPPATLTQQAIEVAQTAKASNATATQSAKNEYATQTQQSIGATQTERANNATATQDARNHEFTATAKVRTQTAVAKAATATEIASYNAIYWKELATYPNNYIGEKVVVRGRIFNVIDDVIQIYFAGTYEALYITMLDSFSGLYEDDTITVYGIVTGTECFTNSMGGEVCQPAIVGSWWTKP